MQCGSVTDSEAQGRPGVPIFHHDEVRLVALLALGLLFK